MTAPDDDAVWRLKLATWLSPAFPVGGFAFSNGLEWTIEAGDIADGPALVTWIDDLLRHGAPRVDAVLLAATWRSPTEIAAINELALALAPSAERRLETVAQGTAFRDAVATAWPREGLGDAPPFETAYAVAVGEAARAHAVPLKPTLEAFALAGIAALASAALRLGLIGQRDAQSAIAANTASIVELARFAERATLVDLGTCAWRADIASMRHETQYSRLFRS